jgi:hypothetical protein
MRFLQNPQPPRLPDPPSGYQGAFFTGFNNILRLYLSRLSTVLNSLLGPNGGQYIDRPNGLFFNVSDQPIAFVNAAQPVLFTQTYLSNAVRINAGTDSKFFCDVAGIYNFQFSGQLKSGSASGKQVWLWIVRDGTPIGYTTHQYTLSGSDEHLEVSWNFNIDMQPGQFLELEWAADSTDVTLEAVVATAPHPGIPSAVMAVNFIAPLPETLPTPP